MKREKIFTFVGVTTGGSSVNRLFPLWMEVLGRSDVVLEGVDHPIGDRVEAYRQTVERIMTHPDHLGGLVTTHKLSITAAALDLFDEFGPYAQQMQEVSCIAKRDGRLLGFAKDPITSGKALNKIIDSGYFGRMGGEVLCLGTGGAALATLLHLANAPDPADRPRRFVTLDIDQSRLDHAAAVVEKMDTDIEVVLHKTQSVRENDQMLATMPPYSLVINATGMGKDRPGSPLSDQARFPQNGVVWEFNYRGERLFYQQALAQAAERPLTVVDGWDYFIFGWLEVIAEVLQFEISPSIFSAIKAVSTR